MRLPAKSVLALLLPLAASFAGAQAPPLGGEFAVNTATASRQDFPGIASGGKGGFVVVWRSFDGGRSDQSVFGQRFDSLGEKAGAEFPASTETSGQQRNPVVGVDAAGNFEVVWDGPAAALSSDIFGHRFGSSGAPIGSEFPVNTATSPPQTSAAIAMKRSGEFVVVWGSGGDQDGSSSGIFGQRFGASGAKVGGEFPVNAYTTGFQVRPAVAMDDAGNFVVVWQSYQQDGSNYGVFGQRFDRSGSRVGSEFLVNSYTTGRQERPSIAVGHHGEFLVVWESPQFGSNVGVFGQRFNSSAEKLGPELQISTNAIGPSRAPSVANDRNGGFVVVWQDAYQDGSGTGITLQRYDLAGNHNGPAFPVNVYTTGAQTAPKVVDDGSGFVIVWNSKDQDGSDYGVFGRRQNLRPRGIAVDERGIGTSDLNGVLEPLEAVVVDPEWSNDTALFELLDGTVSNFSGPVGPSYTLLDSSASYGSMPPDSIATCNDGSPGACYAIQMGLPRPAQHWDTFVQENLSAGGSWFWTLHVGDSFSDVPRAQPFYRKIETLLHHGITTGCGGTQYCPGEPVPRDQMAVFLAKAIAGSGELVPATGFLTGQPYNCSAGGVSRFADAAPTDIFCKHVHYLAAQNVTLGCGPGAYCPGGAVTREAMASFVAKAIVAPEGGAAVPMAFSESGRSYSCSAASPNVHFTDVQVSNPFCKHIHFLWAKGVIAGCSATQYCPGQPVNRDALAKFLANAFDLQLYGP